MPTWDQLQSRVSYPLIRPTWVVRPAPQAILGESKDDDDEYDDESLTEDEGERRKGRVLPPPPLRREVMFPVFLRLPRKTLFSVMRVCRIWAEWAVDPSLWKYLSLAHTNINEMKLHGVVRRQPTTLILDWCKISYNEFLWLLCRLPQLQSLHCEGLNWEVIRPLVSPYCPPLSELNISFCEGVDDDTLSALLRPPPFNRPGFRDATSRLRQLTHLSLAGTQIGDISVSLIVRSLPFLTHLDLSSCLRITDYSSELLAHSTSLVSHSIISLNVRGCHRLTPMILPSLAQLPILSRLALHPCDYIPLKAIKVWGETNGYTFDNENIMSRIPDSRSPIDDISDSEIETISNKENEKNKKIQETSNNNFLVEDLKVENEKKTRKSFIEYREVKLKEIENSNLLVKKNKEKSDEAQCEDFKKIQNESPQLKCVLTPLGKSCKISGGKSHEKKCEFVSKDEKLVTTKDMKSEKGGKSFSDSESKSISLCRRSERSNKGRKYKLSFSKQEEAKDVNEADEKSEKYEEGIIPPKIPEKPPKFTKTQKYFSSNVKSKSKKKTITRSKRQIQETVGEKTNPEYEVVQRPLIKLAKTSKNEFSKGNLPCGVEEGLKVRITLKSGSQYLSKLRKKSRDDDSSSPSSSTENKQSLNEVKPSKKRESFVSKKLKSQKEISSKPAEIEHFSFPKKRKERRGSSSSSSSSPCPSPAPCLSLSKKLKVELKPINKIGRRKSEILKSSVNSDGNSTSKMDTSTSLINQNKNTNSDEKSSNRERPERHHRSPRRLSMCQ